MMKTVILEDESLAVERLQLMMHHLENPVEILRSFETVEEAAAWFSSNPTLDFIISDIQLADGLAFDLFKKVDITVPVIFTTAYDQYAIEAFKFYSIDYLLKPVSATELNKAIFKMKTFRQALPPVNTDYEYLSKLFTNKSKYKSRFTGKIGNKLFFIDLKEIAFFYADNKLVFLITFQNVRYLVDYTMDDLEKILDPESFFRINRGTIIHFSAISQVKPYINNRLKIIFKHDYDNFEAIVSRDRVSSFRKWADS
ncbi:MAG: response regulator transcription factor [Bacteroidetes bacterium]|nr:response regulator transcription factor [Bacteroidota bacterium]